MEEDHIDDTSVGLQVQQFLDEWYYRMMHAGMGGEMDREQCAIKALELFEAQGVPLTRSDKLEMSAMDDDDMIEALVKKMPEDSRRAFGHVALQLQLVMSAASRVRCALEEGSPSEVARIMEDGDAGVNSQILKQTILEATCEISEQKEVQESWETSTTRRLARMSRVQAELEQARRELDRANIKLDGFADEQNAKAKGVLMSMAGNNDKVLVKATFNSWAAWFSSYKAEKHIHDKFQKEIDDAQKKLMEYKAAQVANIRNVLQRNTEGNNRTLVQECLRAWAKDVEDEKEDRALAGSLENAKSKMGNLRAVQKDNAKKSMARMCQGNDESLMSLCMQAWVKEITESKALKEFESQVKAQEERMQEYMKGKNEQAKGVLSRMAGSSDTGLLHTCFSAWAEDYKAMQQAREMEELIAGENQKFANLNARMKSNAASTAARANDMEDENQLMMVFMSWATEAKISRLVQHYSGQMDAKKQKLEDVQNMFKKFATELEQGIGSTPRTTRKSHRGSGRSQSEARGRPPQAPPAAGRA